MQSNFFPPFAFPSFKGFIKTHKSVARNVKKTWEKEINFPQPWRDLSSRWSAFLIRFILRRASLVRLWCNFACIQTAQYMHSSSLFLCNLHSQNNSISTRFFYAAAQIRNNKIAQSNYSLVLKFYYFHFPLLRAWDCRVGKIVFILKKIIFAIFHT